MLKDLLELLCGRCERPGVIDGVSAGSAFLIQGPLGEFAAAEFFEGPAPGTGGTVPAEIFRGVDKNEQIAERGESGFDEQCGVEDHGVSVGWSILQLVQDFRANSWPNDLIERFASGLLWRSIAEDECGECRAVNFAVGVEDFGAELRDQGCTHWRSEQFLVADTISIDDLQSKS